MITAIKNWYKNTAAHADAIELEQASLRLVISFTFFVYVSIRMAGNNNISTGEMHGIYYLAAFLVASAFIIGSIMRTKNKSVIRRLFGAWLDICGTSLFMSLTADIGVVLISVYLWVTFGNGFRYGNRYLYHSQILSVVGFSIVLTHSPYWINHQTAGYSLLVMLLVIPLYVAQLITRLNEAKQKAELASARAKEANQAKTRFVANMSHEIRTPLNGIIGISTLFKTTPLNKDQRDLLNTLESSSKLLLSLLNNVLDFTKIEERKVTIDNVAFSAEEAVYDTLEIFRSQANTKSVQLGASVSPTLTRLRGDAVILRQVLANLMGNAIKFTEKGSVTVSATELLDSATHSTVRFEVADTGIGIPANKQSKIFESFTQADASTTRKFGGSGLGLTIAKHIVEAMGGDLQFQSTENVGSRFWFDLKLEKDITTNSHEVPAIAVVEPISRAGTVATNPLNILVCEDEGTNQKIITRLLSLPGHHVDVVENADDMLDLLEARKFDLVITDLNMAGMSGTDALKLYRFTQPTDKDTRFILFTADATLEARQAASDAGFDAFLTKPIDAATLFNTIEKIHNLAPNTATVWMNKALNNPVQTETDLDENNTALDIATLQSLEQIGSNDELFMHRLLKNYMADANKLIRGIETAAKNRHYGELQDLCHALKGNSLSVGAIELAETLSKVGKLSSKNSIVETTDLLNLLNSDFSKLTLAIEDYLRRPEAASQ